MRAIIILWLIYTVMSTEVIFLFANDFKENKYYAATAVSVLIAFLEFTLILIAAN